MIDSLFLVAAGLSDLDLLLLERERGFTGAETVVVMVSVVAVVTAVVAADILGAANAAVAVTAVTDLTDLNNPLSLPAHVCSCAFYKGL